MKEEITHTHGEDIIH